VRFLGYESLFCVYDSTGENEELEKQVSAFEGMHIHHKPEAQPWLVVNKTISKCFHDNVLTVEIPYIKCVFVFDVLDNVGSGRDRMWSSDLRTYVQYSGAPLQLSPILIRCKLCQQYFTVTNIFSALLISTMAE
jgi:hypothetical protein